MKIPNILFSKVERTLFTKILFNLQCNIGNNRDSLPLENDGKRCKRRSRVVSWANVLRAESTDLRCFDCRQALSSKCSIFLGRTLRHCPSILNVFHTTGPCPDRSTFLDSSAKCERGVMSGQLCHPVLL